MKLIMDVVCANAIVSDVLAMNLGRKKGEREKGRESWRREEWRRSRWGEDGKIRMGTEVTMVRGRKEGREEKGRRKARQGRVEEGKKTGGDFRGDGGRRDST